MICHACLTYCATDFRFNVGRDNAWHCPRCKSQFTNVGVQPLTIELTAARYGKILNSGFLTNVNFQTAMKAIKPHGQYYLFCPPPPDELNPAQGVVNIMSEDGERIFFERHGFTVHGYEYTGDINTRITIYTYGTTQNI